MPIDIRRVLAQKYQERKLLVVHGHSSMPAQGDIVYCNEKAVLSYTEPGTLLSADEANVILQQLDQQGKLQPEIKTHEHTFDGHTYPAADVSLKINIDASPNYNFEFVDSSGYEVTE